MSCRDIERLKCLLKFKLFYSGCTNSVSMKLKSTHIIDFIHPIRISYSFYQIQNENSNRTCI